MKRTYIILLLLISAVSRNFAQGALSNESELNTGITIIRDADKTMLHVTYIATERSDLSIKIRDAAGMVLYSVKEEEPKFQHAKSVDLAGYVKGTYYIEVDTEKAQDVEMLEIN